MRRIVFVSALVAALSALPVLARDDGHVVPAHQEPRHVPKLENQWVRVIDVEIPEGERTLYHAHSLDYPYVMITSVTLNNQIYGQQPKEVRIERGVLGYYRASTQGTYTHRFINMGPGTFRAIGIELLKPMQLSGSVSATIPAQPGIATRLDNERVRAYRIALQPGESLGPITIPGPSIRVAMTEGRIGEDAGGVSTETELAPAQFVFRDNPVTTTIRNTGNADVELVEFELK